MDNLASSPEIIGAIIGGVFLLLTTLIGGWFNVRAAQIRAETERAALLSRARPRKAGQPASMPEKIVEPRKQKRPLPVWLLGTGATIGSVLLIGGLVLGRIIPIFPPSTTPTSTPTEATAPTALPGDTPIPIIDDTSAPVGFPGNLVNTNSDWAAPVMLTFDGIDMVLVPAGCFTIGSETGGDEDEQHGNYLCFDQPYWIGRTEVTNAQYRAYGTFEGDNLPRETVLWREARAFCDEHGLRLPTEAEWEYAARGPDNLLYPWGDTLSDVRAINSDNSDNRPWDVGSKPLGVSWVGALDMSGNVWEWVSSLYLPYPYDKNDGREDPTSLEKRAVLGGSFESYDVRPANRYGREEAQYISIGFRCARDWSPADTTP